MVLNPSKSLGLIGAIACLIACAGDFLMLFILGNQYPGYSQLSDTMSSLGASASPVSGILSTWWIIWGILIIVFAFGFRKSYAPMDKYGNLTFWLLITYGLGEGLGTGIFKADRIGDSLTTQAIIHDTLGGVGLFAILILPLVVRRITPHFSGSGFRVFSNWVLAAGFVCWFLFSFRYLNHGNNLVAQYKGLWQRLFVLDYYIYISALALWMLRKNFKNQAVQHL